jgi:SnoaL-like domain
MGSVRYPSAEDEREITRLIDRYGHVLDERKWSLLPEIFTEKATFDATAAGYHAMTGLEAIREHWSGPSVVHPLGHHATNVLVTMVTEDEAEVRSKGISVFADDSGRGEVSSVLYVDRVVRTGSGWRIALRQAHRRLPADVPAPS